MTPVGHQLEKQAETNRRPWWNEQKENSVVASLISQPCGLFTNMAGKEEVRKVSLLTAGVSLFKLAKTTLTYLSTTTRS